MKRITKSKAPEFYEKFLKTKKTNNWEEAENIRHDLRQHILIEQKNQCAYTEVYLKDVDSCHIDHFRRKDANYFPSEVFEYNNLLVSTNKKEYGAIYKDSNIKKEDYDSLIDPVSDYPEEHLYYSKEGIIYAMDDSQKGQKTIDLFNLNCTELKERRAECINNIEKIKEQVPLQDALSIFKEFEGMIRNLYNKI